MLITSFIGLLAVIIPATFAVDNDTDATKSNQFKMAVTQIDKLNMASDEDLFYDFANNPYQPFSKYPGSVCNANAATWPWLGGVGMTIAQLNLPPCSMLQPHHHRATNIVVAVNGTTQTRMIQENGGRVVLQTLSPGQMTIFPQASMHTMVNDGCEQNLLYSFLNSDDPSTVNVINNLWALGEDIVTRVMPFMANDSIYQQGGYAATKAMIPPIGSGANTWTADCLARCGVTGSSGDTKGSGGQVAK